MLISLRHKTLLIIFLGALNSSFKNDENPITSNNERVSGADYFMNIGLSLKDKGKTNEAILYMKKARTQYHSSGNYDKEITCLFYLGCLCEQKNDNISALQYFTESNYHIRHYRIAHPLQSYILYKVGRQYFIQNKFEQSYKVTNQCIIETKRVKTADSTMARIYRQKGILEYYKGDYTSSIESLQTSVTFGSKAFGKYSLFVSDQLNNLGVMNFMIGRNDEALAYYQQSESLMRLGHISSQAGLAGTYTNIGLIFRNKNDFENALLFYNKALELSLTEPSAQGTVASTYINIGSIYRLKNNYEKEFESLNKALEFSKKNIPVLLPKVYQQLAIYYTEVKNFNKAEWCYELSIHKAKQIFPDNPEIAYFYVNYGDFQAQRKNYTKSLEAYQKALPLLIKFFGEHHTSTSGCLLSMAGNFADRNLTEKALSYLQEAIIANCFSFNNQDVFSNPEVSQAISTHLMVELMTQKALILEKLANKQTNGANKLSYKNVIWNTYHLTLKIIDRIRMGYLNEESRLFLYENEQNTYNKAINCALDLYKQTKNVDYLDQAFVIADKTHASSLQSAIKEKEVPKALNSGDSLLFRETKLKKEMAMYQELLLKERSLKKPDSLKLKFWSGKTADLTFKLEQLQSLIKLNKPAWYQYKYRTNDNQLLRQIQAKLEANEALVEFFYSDSIFYSFCLNNKRLQYKSCPLPHNFRLNLQQVLYFVSQPKIYTSDSSANLAYRRSAWELYQLLLQPYESEIKDKKLIIIPFEELTYIPFETLLTAETLTKPYNFKELPYLVKHHSIRYVYAANLLNIRNNIIPSGQMAAFAPTYTSSYKQSKVNHNLANNLLESLPETSDEVKAISEYFPGKIYASTMASEENFKKYAYRYSTLHLAMHAIIDDESPMYSRLVFTPNSSGNSDDLLYTYEIPNIRLNAELVVLSACNTGVGKLRKGEGMMSLTRSFAFAGVPSIVMTLWSVNDNSSASLMKNFYKHLSSGFTKDEALSSAKLQYLESSDMIHAHPFYWSGYVLIGDNAPVLKSNHAAWIPIGGIILVVTVTFALILLRRKKRK